MFLHPKTPKIIYIIKNYIYIILKKIIHINKKGIMEDPGKRQKLLRRCQTPCPVQSSSVSTAEELRWNSGLHTSESRSTAGQS